MFFYCSFFFKLTPFPLFMIKQYMSFVVVYMTLAIVRSEVWYQQFRRHLYVRNCVWAFLRSRRYKQIKQFKQIPYMFCHPENSTIPDLLWSSFEKCWQSIKLPWLVYKNRTVCNEIIIFWVQFHAYFILLFIRLFYKFSNHSHRYTNSRFYTFAISV